MLSPIIIKDLGLSFSKKNCFQNFSTSIYPSSRIGIIGRNGCGKSSLLKVLAGKTQNFSGQLQLPENLCTGYVEQAIFDFDSLSGSQRFNKRLSEVLAQSPHLLLLDEPTNHLDCVNRKSLLHKLMRYRGTLILVSHDTELLSSCCETIWHLHREKVEVFSGPYKAYLESIKKLQTSLEKELELFKREKKQAHHTLMKEQKRVKKRKAYGEKKYHGDKLALRSAQGRGQLTANKNYKRIQENKEEITKKLSILYLPKKIVPRFSLESREAYSSEILSISEASIGYKKDALLLENISLSIGGKEHVAIKGKNASGKSTLLKAILADPSIYRSGHWNLPSLKSIGYLDQHYLNLNRSTTVLQILLDNKKDWYEKEAKKHLQAFLFHQMDPSTQKVSKLSEGEKARLSLALIAANPPCLLLLDEITNNLDMETKEHVTQVLKAFPGALILVSHDEDFLKEVGIDRSYMICGESLI